MNKEELYDLHFTLSAQKLAAGSVVNTNQGTWAEGYQAALGWVIHRLEGFMMRYEEL